MVGFEGGGWGRGRGRSGWIWIWIWIWIWKVGIDQEGTVLDVDLDDMVSWDETLEV